MITTKRSQMLNLKEAAATQLTMRDGTLTDWKVTLNEEELYTLPSYVTVQDTFEIRRIIEKMMSYAHEQGMLDMAATKDLEIEQILETGNTQLNALMEHNDSLAGALARHMEKG